MHLTLLLGQTLCCSRLALLARAWSALQLAASSPEPRLTACSRSSKSVVKLIRLITPKVVLDQHIHCRLHGAVLRLLLLDSSTARMPRRHVSGGCEKWAAAWTADVKQ